MFAVGDSRGVRRQLISLDARRVDGLIVDLVINHSSVDCPWFTSACSDPKQSMSYFGADGDRLQMMLNFAVNQRLFYALATADIEPLVWALEETQKRPADAQWVQFLRSHDELDLGRLTEEQRQKVFDAFAPKKSMQLYNRGIRRRLAPMLGNNRQHLELAFSLLFSLPGTR